MSTTNTPTIRPNMPLKYKEQVNVYMKEYRRQHIDAIVETQKRYREAHKNDEHLRKKRCKYSKNIITR